MSSNLIGLILGRGARLARALKGVPSGKGLGLKTLLARAMRSYRCEWLTVQAPAAASPGTTVPLRLHLANRGTRRWRADEGSGRPVQLVVRVDGAVQPTVHLPQDVAPGQSVELRVDIHLPNGPPQHSCRVELALVEQNVAWFEQHGVKPLVLNIGLEGPPPHAVEWLGHNLPQTWHSGASHQVYLRVRNAGSRTWRASGPAPVDLALFLDGQLHMQVRVRDDVAPGGEITLSFRLTLPDGEGNRALRLTFVEQGVAWFDENQDQVLVATVRVERHEGSESRGEYRSCAFIEGGVSLHYNSLHVCSVPHHNTGQPFVAPFDGTRFPLEQLFAVRDTIRTDNAGERGHTACQGCALLEKKQWWKREYPLDFLGLGNWLFCNIECDYCELQTQNLASYAKTFRPYGLKDTIRRLIGDKLLAPYAIIDWGGGGEPTFYREFQDVLEMLLEYGTFNYIHTNGTRNSDTLRISAPERVHLICSVDAGLPQTYVRIKKRNYLDRVWQNLEAYRQRGVGVSVKYIMKSDNCSQPDLNAFAERAARLRPLSVVLDIDFNASDASAQVVEALGRLTILLRESGMSVRYGHTGDRFRPEMQVGRRVEDVVHSAERARDQAQSCRGRAHRPLVQIGTARAGAGSPGDGGRS